MQFNWDVFTQLSDLQIQLHWATAVIAFFIAPVIFLLPKGRALHITLGVLYMTLMVTTAVAAFFIRRGDVAGMEYLSLKGMTYIHVFVPVTLIGIFGGLWGILVQKNRKAHRGPLIGSYIGGTDHCGRPHLPARAAHEPDALGAAGAGSGHYRFA